jgi:7,8-dihydropterin-6-yl-methyl-4-(beta-D-ribofuranosyl)aminobenzene 5'-phosphate synthase
MSIAITTLMDNTQGEHTGLIAEHGLSFLVETDDTSLLFDTGRSAAFLTNAQKLCKDLTKVEHVVLSHGHYDHSGGFRSFLEQVGSPTVSLHVGKGFFTPKYARFNASYQYLGNDFDESFLDKYGVHYEEVGETQKIANGVWMVTNFSHAHPEEIIHPRFMLQGPDGWIADVFSDEVLLVIESALGLIVLVGCSHPGILNMLDTVRAHFHKPIYALLGGTHLVEADSERTKCTLTSFIEQGIAVLGISHCSGSEAIALATEGSSVHYHNTLGSSLILEQ